MPCSSRTLLKRVDEVGREDGGERLAQSLGAGLGVHDLHLRVPAFDAVVEIDGEDADVDGFDDVLVELLEALELGDLLLEAAVELGVLDGDADVAGERFEQFHVFAGEEVAVVGAAEADDGDGAGASAFAIGHAAGQVVVEVESAGGVALRFWAGGGPAGGFRGRCGCSRRSRSKSRKRTSSARRSAACRLVRPWDAARSKWLGGWRSRFAFGGEEDGDAGDQQGLREAFDDGVEQGAQVGL